jgi:DNA polymerase III subunit chi
MVVCEPGEAGMTEIFFYHLQRVPLDRALPQLLEKCLERGWRVAVQAEEAERLAALDEALWTYADDAFLPHGTLAEGADHPIVLLSGPANPNGAAVRVLVDGAPPQDLAGYQRALILFDGNDDEAVALARRQWSALKGEGHTLAYWQQDDGGRWTRKG